MLNKIELKNFGPWSNLDWNELGKINLIIGGNGSGKTFLLKAIYSALRTLEDYKKGQENRSLSELLAYKLRWTFQTENLGDLVTKGDAKQPDRSALAAALTINHAIFKYEFGSKTKKQINHTENSVSERKERTFFLPAKEVLSLHHIIEKSRRDDRVFGFDDTYLDLIDALKVQTSKGRKFKEFSQSRKKLKRLFGGKVWYAESAGKWFFYDNQLKTSLPMGVSSEGVKKLSMLDTLLGNGQLQLNSCVLIDEPESALHPKAISEFLDIIALLAERGIQFVIATHSYFVIKKLALIAQKKQWSIPTLNQMNGAWQQDDLIEGMPDNPIIDESISLYEQQIELTL
jgi:AAA15 family ATPase/GTPase